MLPESLFDLDPLLLPTIFSSVSREDYLVFRVGFINQHGLSESFNFRDYVIRSMEVEFKKVISISWWLWLFVVLFLLLDVAVKNSKLMFSILASILICVGWHTYFSISFIPLIIILVIGTKQQHIISTLALEAKKHAEKVLAAGEDTEKVASSRKISNAPTISFSDKLFWFDNPTFLLRLIHFAIFQNSFELAVFFWLVFTFGWNSCIMGNHSRLIVRLIIGIFTQLLASYSTLPIYALVTQMGTQLKSTVFTKPIYEGLQGWKAKAERRRIQRASNPTSEDNSVSNGKEPTTHKATAAEETVVVPLSTELPPLARESTVDLNLDTAQPSTDLTKMCQLMYGKQRGLEKVKAARINPN